MLIIIIIIIDREIVVDRATRCGLDGPGTESLWEQDFPHPASYTVGTGSLPGVKRTGRGVEYPPHLAQSLKKEYSNISTPTLSLQGLF
jgi:hypothetical protein